MSVLNDAKGKYNSFHNEIRYSINWSLLKLHIFWLFEIRTMKIHL